MTTARTRDRRVYLRSHPVLFALLAGTRRWPALRLGGTVLVHDRAAYLAALTRVPLDRTSELTTGGAASRLAGAGTLFDQRGDSHRQARRDVSDQLGAAGVERLRPIWTAVLRDRLAPLAAGGTVDLVSLAAELAGATAAALLEIRIDPLELAAAAREAAATAAHAHLPGPGRRRAGRASEIATARLLALIGPHDPTTPGRHAETAADRCPASVGPHDPAIPGRNAETAADRRPGSVGPHDPAIPGRNADTAADRRPALGGRHDPANPGRGAMLAVAAINTTVAAVPRAVAWVCDDDLWEHAGTGELTDELLRVTAPTPLLPRVAAAGADLRPGHPRGCPVRAGDRLLLVARHAADAHRRDPDPHHPADTQTAHLVFGAGPHACPGARLARAQLTDVLAALAPYRPVVRHARADRRSALPGWSSLIVQATRTNP